MTITPIRAALLALSLTQAPAALAKDAVPAAPAQAVPAPEAPGAKAPTAAQTEAQGRQKKCGAEWRALSGAEKVSQGPKWPQFWSKCNARLKGGDKA